MENKSSPWDPLAVMLSMYGSKISSKLLFKFPFAQSNPLLSYKQLTSSTYHLNQASNSSGKGSEQPNESNESEDKIRDETEQYLSFSDDTLAQISCPGNSSICGQKFDVKINGIRFVGFPLMLEHNNVTSELLELGAFTSQSEKNGNSPPSETDIFVRSFNVVFVLKATASYNVVESYQQLASKLGIGLRFEEKRDGFVTRETKTMLNIHDQDAELSPEDVYRKILEKSSLAQNLHHVFESLIETGIINFVLNENLTITFCLYHVVHNTCNENYDSVNIVNIEKCLNKVQPYHGILVYDIKSVWSSLNDLCSGSIMRFLNVYKPTKSLQTLAIDADIALNHVYAIARHLVIWGKACIIYPLCETNVYVLAPSAVLYHHSKFVDMFAERFQLNLTSVLSYFSTPVRLGDYQSPTGPFFGNQNKLVDILIWMLQHRFLVQHHTYVYFLSPSSHSDEMINKSLLKAFKESDGEKIQLDGLDADCRDLLATADAAHDPEDLFLFLRLLKYFDGAHHLEEIMYRENLVRFELITVLDKFRPLLLTCVREDEIASAFCMSK